MIIDIRFNTNYPTKSQYEWRLIVDGIEQLVNNVRIDSPTYTTSTFIEDLGMKWHMTTIAKELIVDRTLSNNIIAFIK
jgi:hypothetical protein